MDMGEWQPMQQATPINHPQAIPGQQAHPLSGHPLPNSSQPQSISMQGPPGQLPYQSQFQYQAQGQFSYRGQGQFPYQGRAQFQSAGTQFAGQHPGGNGLGVLRGPVVSAPSRGNFHLQGSVPQQHQQQASPRLQWQQQQKVCFT